MARLVARWSVRSSNSTNMTGAERRATFGLAGVYGFRMLGLFLILPVFALYAEKLPGATPLLTGLAIGIYGLTQAVLQIPFGLLSDRIGRKPLLVVGLALSGVSTAVLGLTHTLPVFLTLAAVAGAASGVYNSPQQAAVADIIGKARGGTAIATFQMMSDFGSIVGSLGVGVLAQQLSFGWAFAISGAMLLVAAVGWTFAPETRERSPVPHTPARALGPEAAGELP